MDIIIKPKRLIGEISAIPSKSQAHRVLICSAYSDRPTKIICKETNHDIEATVDCLRRLGADITGTEYGYNVIPATDIPEKVNLFCRESGSTLRFLLPIVGALGVSATFHLEGRLADRPLSPLWNVLQEHGCKLSKTTENTISISGKLSPGDYSLAGDISSQYITGLLFAFSLIDGTSNLHITGVIQSLPYIQMTQQVLAQFGVESDDYKIHGRNRFSTPGHWNVEGDWSNAAFFWAANELGSSVKIRNLNDESIQGDRQILNLLIDLRKPCTISAAHIPDLIPILSIVATQYEGAVFTDTKRLRFKESDRVIAIERMLHSLGCRVNVSENQINVYPGRIQGGTVDSFGDHRIAMAAAIAATVAQGDVVIQKAQSVEKSYPGFWDTYRALGGDYEQIIR